MWAVFTLYGAAVAYLTLAPRWGTSGALTSNFIPLLSIVELLDGRASWQLVVKNLFGNLVLFVPLAAFLVLALEWAPKRVLVIAAKISIVIELVQGLGLTDGRQANIDDVLLNVGGAAGFVGCWLLVAKRQRRTTAA